MRKIPISSVAYIIGGPTASGKSDYALNLAKQVDGEIINGDSMQLYSHLHILTARPTELYGIPHHLYGVLEGNQISSLGWWYEAACKVIQEVRSRGKVPIVVGGTGLYLRALTRGLSAVPDIPEPIRQETRHLAQTLSEEDFFALVALEDPKIKDVLHPHDTQRLTRALEVVRATHTSIQDCQGQPQKILEFEYQYFVLLPPRDVLYQRINDRFIWMVENGALREVEDLLAQNINLESPILKAVGVPELTEYLKGDMSLEQAISQGQQSTRRYAKRQTTWFTRQVPEAEMIR
ncbi:MAG: tRNA (adenosine(37)-N6)-dimethylallyltransferase MiaA [Candidatus Paracaedibacter sp.]